MNDCIKDIQKAIGKDKVLIGNSLKLRYTHIWRMNESLNARALILATNTDQIALTLRICNHYTQTIVVHGGLTNLVGGTETTEKDIVISLEKINQIIEIDTECRSMTVEAGAILEEVQQAAADKGMLFPLNFGAKGSAQIGGIVASNAGGLRVLKYGMTRNLVLGLEAVLADGTIISSLKKIMKDNSAYDLKHLFVGSEGTLGIITKVVLKLTEAPSSRSSAYVAFNEYNKVVTFLKYIDQGLAGQLSGFELIWANTYECMTSPDSVPLPIKYGYKYYVLIESLGSDQVSDQKKLLELLEKALDKDMILDAVPAQTKSDLDWFWKIREDVHVIKSACTYDHHFDISLPITSIGEYASKIILELEKLDFVESVYTFGHVADGNIHFIVDRTSSDSLAIKTINDIVYKPIKKFNGSISAEHGIGLHKKSYLQYSRTEHELKLMRTLKVALDPKSILNPRNIF